MSSTWNVQILSVGVKRRHLGTQGSCHVPQPTAATRAMIQLEGLTGSVSTGGDLVGTFTLPVLPAALVGLASGPSGGGDRASATTLTTSPMYRRLLVYSTM